MTAARTDGWTRRVHRAEWDALAPRRDAAAASIDELSPCLADAVAAWQGEELDLQRTVDRLAAARTALAGSATRMGPLLAAAGLAEADLAKGAAAVGATSPRHAAARADLAARG